jgi:hypothetical protein
MREDPSSPPLASIRPHPPASDIRQVVFTSRRRLSYRKDPERTAIIYGDNTTLPQKIWENWTYTTHYGQYVGWIPRSIWLLFGLVPLLLAVTGVSMMLIKRRMRRARKLQRAADATGSRQSRPWST